MDLSLGNMVNLALVGTETVLLWFLVKAGIYLYDAWPHPAIPLHPVYPPIDPLHPPPPHFPYIPLGPTGCPDKPTGLQLTVPCNIACTPDANGETPRMYSRNYNYLYQAACTYVNSKEMCPDDPFNCQIPMVWSVQGAKKDGLSGICPGWKMQGINAEGTVTVTPVQG